MKRYLLCMLLGSMLAAAPLIAQSAPSASNAQVLLAFTGGSVWTSQTTGTCIWYFPILGDLTLTDLFQSDASGAPAVDKEHAYFIWVSDWNIQWSNLGMDSPVALAVVPEKTATIYYSPDPKSRIWKDTNERSTWGVPIATFARGAGLFHSPDGFRLTDKFFFSAQLTSSREVTLQSRSFNFRNLIHHGMTCFEFGQNSSTTETGTCIAMGN